MNKKQIFIQLTVLHTLLFTFSSWAQVNNSVYSMFGVGQIIDNSFGINKSLGGTGIAFQSGKSVNYLNPASYIGIPSSSFNIEMGAYGILSKARNNKTSQTDGSINVSYFAASLYLKKWWATVFGIVPFSSVDYKINSTDQVGGDLTFFDKTYTGSGGLSRVFIGNSLNLYKGLSVGFNASYIFGPISQTETAVTSGTFTGYELKNTRTAHSGYFDYGMQYAINHKDLQYTIGLVYGASEKLKTTDELEFTYDGTTTSLEQDEKLKIKIPQKVGIGFSIKKGENFRAGFDFERKNWSAINFSNQNLVTRNSNRYSFGAEYFPNQKDKLYQRLIYRIGANYHNSYLEIDHNPINSMGISFGIGIPYNALNIINLTMEYGEEGTLNNGLIKNTYLVFQIDFSLHEVWIKRRY